jgi:AAA domain-containing protein
LIAVAFSDVLVEESAAESVAEGSISIPSGTDEDTLIEIIEDYANQPRNPNRHPEWLVNQLAEQFSIPKGRIRELVIEHASAKPSYPSALTPLVTSGQAFYENGQDGRPSQWYLRFCEGCRKFVTTDNCCGKIRRHPAFVEHELSTATEMALGRKPIPEPIRPKTAEQVAQSWAETPWWLSFRGVDELEGDGSVKLYIRGFLPAGTILICGHAKEGKTNLAMSFVKALTSGRPLFGRPEFEVFEPVPVLYLAAEVLDGELKDKCRKFGITNDKSKFICRTLSQGPMFGLDDPKIEALVGQMKPVVFLDTLARFHQGDDEDDAKQSAKLGQAIFNLLGWGAKAVVVIHHSTKDLNKRNPTMQQAVRGSGDIAAWADAIWLVMRDDRLWQNGKGPLEIDAICWPRTFIPQQPVRLALTKKAPEDPPKGVITYMPGIISVIDETSDLGWVEKRAAQKDAEVADHADRLERMVQEDPTMSVRKLAKEIGLTSSGVYRALKGRGWDKGNSREARWTHRPPSQSEAA